MPAILGKMNRISRCGALFRAEKLPISDLTPCQHSFVFAICKHPGSTQERLAQHLCLNKSTVARTLTQMEANGYVTRIADQKDKRAFLIYPTEKMQQVLPLVRAITHEWNERLAEKIPQDELEIFLSVLARMADRAKELTGGNDEGEDVK